MTVKYWTIEEATGYRPQTTFYSDFSIAERFGENAIRYRFEWALAWEKNVIFMTELVMVLNWKIWEHYKTNEPFARLYSELYEKAYEIAEKNFDEEGLKYFYRTIE